MQIKQLNIQTGDNTDLLEFMELVTSVVTQRGNDPTQCIHSEAMAVGVAQGGIIAFVPVGQVGVQIWERGAHWLNKGDQVSVLRAQWMLDATDIAQVAFMNAGIAKVKSMTTAGLTMVSIHTADQLYPIAPHCVDGEIVNVQQGSNVLQQRPEPCSSAAGSTPTPTSTIALSTAPCNLLTGPSTALYAGVVINQAGSNIAITGCGTAVSPFTFNSGNIGVGSITTTNLSVTNVSGAVTLNTSGVNNSTCGYNIVDGQVRTWTNPITTLVAGRGVSVGPTTPGVNCSWTVDTKNDNKTIVGVSCGSAFVNPASGALPVNGSWVTGSAVVYGTRLFLNTPTPATVYSAAGGVLASAPTMLVYASNALALAALDSVHTFSGTTAC